MCVCVCVLYINISIQTHTSPYRIMLQKIEIMFFEQGKLCVTYVKLCAKSCANSNKKAIFFHYIYISSKFLIKKSPQFLLFTF